MAKLKLKISLPRLTRCSLTIEIINRATKIILNQLMSKRLQNKLNLKIHLRKSVLDNTTSGAFVLLCNGSKKQNEHKIILDYNMNTRNQLEILAHELVHVHQAITNKLQYRTWKSDGDLHARWNGKEVGKVHEIPYRERPWEVEAYSKQKDLYKFVQNITTDVLYENELRKSKENN